MAADLVITQYIKRARSDLPESGPRYLDSELQRLEKTINDLVEAVPQVATRTPKAPRTGTIRYAKAPWDPLGTGDAWVWFNGTAWAAL